MTVSRFGQSRRRYAVFFVHFLRRRVPAFLFTAVFLTSLLIPPVSAYADEQALQRAITPAPAGRPAAIVPDTKTEMSQNYPAAEAPKVSSQPLAADVQPQTGVARLFGREGVARDMGDALQSGTTKHLVAPHELTEKRTATSKVLLGKDGTQTERQYLTPQFYQKNGNWTAIDNSLVEDKNVADSTHWPGQALGVIKSWIEGTPTAFKTEGNDWQARFAPSEDAMGMLRIVYNGKTLTMRPQGAAGVEPEMMVKNGSQSVRYENLWPGVTVEYQVHNSQLKELVYLHDKNVTPSYAFTIEGASLVADPNNPGGFTLSGALEGKFSIAPVTVAAQGAGPADGQRARQAFTNGILTTTVDGKWLKALPASEFPVVVDPTFWGTTVGSSYTAYKSDGYSCGYSSGCDMNAGTTTDSWKSWRTTIYAPYTQLGGKVLLGATLHLEQWAGATGSYTFTAARASCGGYNCIDTTAPQASASIDTSGDIDVRAIYQTLQDRADWGSSLILRGEESPSLSWKAFDPDRSYVSFAANLLPVTPTITLPAANQTFTDPQVSLKVDPVPVTETDGDTLKYMFRVSTGPDGATGTVISSGDIPVSQWTVPDGVLQDGTTYYVTAFTTDGYNYSNPSTIVPFRIDSRTGKDATQAFDTLGPVSVDLVTGNLVTGASSHASSALGGSLGVSLDYNSPLKSRNGLVGEYFDNTSQSGTPKITRVDPAPDFNWDLGSPGAGVPSDNFSVRWTGSFIAPVTGDYYFGGNNDDGMSISLNGSLKYNSTGCFPGVCFGGTATSLTAGQVVPVTVIYWDTGSYSFAHMRTKIYQSGTLVDERYVPSNWLRTDVRPVQQNTGLIGRYYTDDGSHNFNSSSNVLFMQRSDPLLSFNWGSDSPVSGGYSDNFMVRWTGYITVPGGGSYQVGTSADDGSRIYLNGSSTPTLNKWTDGTASDTWGNAYTFPDNVPVPIVIEYYEHTGQASMAFKIKQPADTYGSVVPSSWLSTQAQVVPDGWSLGLDADGNLGYERLRSTANSAVLTDSTGSTHEYTWTGSGYKPPANEDAQLVRNADGTFTLQDTDGRTYLFSAAGLLTSATTPLDDRKPAALKYTYGVGTTDGPSRIIEIADGVDNSRKATVYYSGDSACGTAPSGFTTAPSGMLCAVKTNDNRATYFYYTTGQLSRIVKPGGETTDFMYESVGGYQRIVAIRDPLANDAIAAGVRADNAEAKTEITYDTLGRVSSVKQPAATAGASRITHTIEYLPGTLSYPASGYYGATQQHITGATEPNGFGRRLEYDGTFRTLKDYDIANLATTTQWQADKDLVLSTTDATGLKTTTIYDDEDRPTDSYGPAPSSYYGTDNKPTSTYTAQVPRTETKYDEGLWGPSVAWYNLKGTSLTGAPKLHTTGLTDSSQAVFYANMAAPPVTQDSGMDGLGFTATGRIRVSQTGTYTFTAYHDDGARLSIDDLGVFDSWTRRSETIGSSANVRWLETGKSYRFRFDYATAGTPGSVSLHLSGPGQADTINYTNYLSPDYSLTTTAKVYDATLGNSTTTTNYGTNPELGLAQSSSVDPTGLNLTTSSTYETQGATGTFLRQTAKYLPGADTAVASTGTQYTYYGATETRDDPCTTGTTEAYKQAGMLKLRTDPDPDGTGSQTPRTTETIYDDAGKVVATRVNADSWTCTTYDSRERVASTVVPAYNGNAARTIQNDYAVGGSPLVTTTWDGNGWIVKWSDLLGRTTKYRDVYDDETTTSYDSLGRVSQRVSPMGTEAYTYDNYNRLVDQKFDAVTYATVHYDQYSRTDYIDYSNAGQQRLTYGRDSLSRLTSKTYRMGNGTTTISDTVNRTQSGRIVNDIAASGGNELWNTYGYDGAGRLTSTSIGGNSFTYTYGTQDTTTCGTGNNKNANSGKNSNRTSQTINGVTTYFCYDYADQLIDSSNALYHNPAYDTHGNMTLLGTGTTPLRLYYDSSNRSTGYEQYNSSTTGVGLYYDRDVQGRIIGRYKNTITNGSWAGAGSWFYHYTGSSDSPAYVRDNTWAIVEKNLSLAGGISLTIKPFQSGNAGKQYSLPSVNGHILLTTDASGTNTSTGNGPASSFTYDPYGNILTGSNYPSNTATSSSYAWAGSLGKLTETSLALTPISMGARVYLSVLGRFTQVDPIQGGTPNAYVYASDPINSSDYTGRATCSQLVGIICNVLFPTQKGNITPKGVLSLSQANPTPRAPSPIVLRVPTPQSIPIGKVSPGLRAGGAGSVPREPRRFSWYGAGNSAMGWYYGGALVGGIIGCGVGAAFTFGAAAAACVMVGGTWATVGGGGWCANWTRLRWL